MYRHGPPNVGIITLAFAAGGVARACGANAITVFLHLAGAKCYAREEIGAAILDADLSWDVLADVVWVPVARACRVGWGLFSLVVRFDHAAIETWAIFMIAGGHH